VYDAPADAGGATDFYTRATQRLISALSAPTEEGELYEIDTKLRPSGSKGPVAVRLSSFERYYAEEAWTWEMQALTRLRAVAGDQTLAARVEAVAQAALSRPRDVAKTLAEVAEMRGRMDRERPSKSAWDLKLSPGGFVDIEFIAQALQLTTARRAPEVLSANTGEALSRLVDAGVLTRDQGDRLIAAWRTWSGLQQLLRRCVEGDLVVSEAPPPLRERLAVMLGGEDLDERIKALQQQVRADFVQIVGAPDAKP
jgi:glutamate-ammonia-ligase adenylyltransferase